MSIYIDRLTRRKAARIGASSAAAGAPRGQEDLDLRLLDSATLGRADAVARWLGHGADPGARDTAGMTPLMCAAFVGCGRCVEMLLPVSDLLALNLAGDDVYACAARSPSPLPLRAAIMSFHRSQIELRYIESQALEGARGPRKGMRL